MNKAKGAYKLEVYRLDAPELDKGDAQLAQTCLSV